MKKVLIFSYYWPPGSGPGVQRWLKMSRFLPEFGIEPIIITVKNGAYPSRDESLLKEIPKGLRVIHTDTLEPFEIFNTLRGKKGNEISVGLSGMKNSSSFIQRFGIWLRANFFIPDARKGWKHYALKAAIPLMSEVDAIITTGPPHSTHFIGAELKKKYGKIWLADFRDPWSNIHYHELMPMWKSSLRKHKAQEDFILKTADSVTVVSEGMKREFANRRDDIQVIYNGYDSMDFHTGITPDMNHFVMSYVGNLKPNQNVSTLWNVISELIQSNTEFAKRFKLRLIGKKDNAIIEELNALLPNENIELIDHLSHARAVEAMCKSNLLLFVIPQAKNNELILTGKLFEYLASGRPMFSIGPIAGDASKIIQESKMSPMIDYSDKEGMKRALLDHFTHSKGESQTNENIKKFSRSFQTEALALALKKMMNQSSLKQ
jgi:glycosyltransferase involved in cell wall biosynthesis